jgi:hypothetical protein
LILLTNGDYGKYRGAVHSKNPVHFVKKSGKNPNKSGKSIGFSLQKSAKKSAKSAKKSVDF